MSGCKSGYRINETKNKCRCATCPNGYEKCESAVSDEGETGWKEWTKNLVAPCHKSGLMKEYSLLKF